MAKLGKTMSGNALSMPSGESEVTRLWKEFRNVDASGDGYVSRKEMQSAAKKALKLSREEAETVFDMADVNGDNQLDFGEYFKVRVDRLLNSELVLVLSCFLGIRLVVFWAFPHVFWAFLLCIIRS